MKCDICGKEFDRKTLKQKKYICDRCGYYMRIPAQDRIAMFTDSGSFREWYSDIETRNILGADGYEEKILRAQEKTGLREAVVVGSAKVYGELICMCVCDARFLMGSMGYVVGEKITLAIERATKEQLPVFIFCCSGGARMQEGIVSLMQMEKTAAAIGRHSAHGGFLCTVLTDPTTGGVTASFAMLGDVVVAEPGAMIGFAGKRVIKQTIGKELPEGFQTAEFQVEHGLIDGIVERKKLKKMMQFLLIANRKREGYNDFREVDKEGLLKLSKSLIVKKKSKKSAWEKIKFVRSVRHPGAVEYINEIFDIFVELKGDRHGCDDRAVVGGIALLNGQPITVIAEDRGKNIQENIEKNFGMPKPEGYRKALRLMKQAEKFNRPIINFISTAGAYCGIEAEQHGIGEAIAENLLEMSKIKVPILSIIVGEAGSGGALATAVGNEVWMFENATYSILSPEGYASIVWKDSSRAEEAADMMHIVAADLKKLFIIDKIISEHGEATEENILEISQELKAEIIKFLQKNAHKTGEELVEERYARFRRL